MLLPDPVSGPGSVEVGFAKDMTVHHEQAVRMAGAVVMSTTDPEIRALSYDIFSTQTAQIGQMQGWLAPWGRGAQSIDGRYMAWMESHGGMGTETMPGMADPAELAALRNLPPGTAQDALFLQLMLRHHQGALGMLEHTAREADDPVVANPAALMLSGQQHEMMVTTAMMAARGVQPL
ncbi:DUF305 domain-containing protein [Pseudonocardia sp. WMMC193]|uniref:DUF305 domain-containing protein n=1 Tax=Pseudonocardia sp. WMMC193 TaxID=2911965 RepID=UPI001F247DF9|nr:DUF305 domain-containing protein [Pseudonocardia sp. WMMC193]MCF7552718.1 DUF305 domain-containing protein [Pseudonocardia sp. WMMC193]